MSNPFLGLDHPPPAARVLAAIIDADNADRLLDALRREDGGVRAFLGVRVSGNPNGTVDRGSLALTASLALLADLASEGFECYGLSTEEFLERSLAVAVWSEELAGRMGGDRATAFALGMLHRLGMVAVARMLFRVKPDVRVPMGRLAPQLAREREEMRLDCLQAGARLLEMWGFPEFAVKAVRHQHHPLLHTGHRKVTVALALAVAMGEAMRRGTLRATVDGLPEPMLDELRVERISLHDCGGSVGERWQGIRATIRATAAIHSM